LEKSTHVRAQLIVLPNEKIKISTNDPVHISILNYCRINNVSIHYIYETENLNYKIESEVHIEKVKTLDEFGYLEINLKGKTITKQKTTTELRKQKGKVNTNFKEIFEYIDHSLNDLLRYYITLSSKKRKLKQPKELLNIFELAIFLNITNEEKYHLLSKNSIQQVKSFFTNYLNLYISIYKSEQNVKSNFYLN
jgi:hypothetical protein